MQNHSQKGSATIIAFIILLATLGGAVVYFKNFPMTQDPSRQPKEQPRVVETNTTDTKTQNMPSVVSRHSAAKISILPKTGTKVHVGEKVKVYFSVEGGNPTEGLRLDVGETGQFIEGSGPYTFFFTVPPDAGDEIYIRGSTSGHGPENYIATTSVTVVTESVNLGVQNIPTTKDMQDARDKKRLRDIKEMQAALELYYDSCNEYPRVPALTVVGSSQFSSSFNVGCPTGTSIGLFIHPLPTNPEPGGAAYQYCSETASSSGICGVSTSGKTESYRLTFKLESQQGTLTSGVHVVTPAGIK